MKKYTSTLNIFDNEGDFTRPSSTISSKDLLPLHNNQDQRFQTDILINGKTNYEEKNTIIQSLEEELVTMKHKMSFVFEKDEEIATLKETITTLKKEASEHDNVEAQNAEYRLEVRQLKEQLQGLRLSTTDQELLQTENNMLKDKLKELGEKEESFVIEEIDELVDVNVPQLRTVLLARLKDKQIQHIEDLIVSYELKRKNKIKKSVMEQLLVEAIHL
jgi:hypothetical protein